MRTAILNFNLRRIYVSTYDSFPGTRHVTDVAWLTANARTIATSIVSSMAAHNARNVAGGMPEDLRWFGISVAQFSDVERIDWIEDNIVLAGTLGALNVFADDPGQQPGPPPGG